MAGVGRNIWVAGVLLAAFGLCMAAMASTVWSLGLSIGFGLTSVVLLRGNRWRSAALLIASVGIGIALLDLMTEWLTPGAMGGGVVRLANPQDWLPPDPVLGYRPRPDTRVAMTETWHGEPVYRVTYTIDPAGARSTPPAPAGADLYLFVGDSLVFGEGLEDDQTLPAQFARMAGYKVRTVAFAAPGYAPNQLVRAFEAGLLDRFAGQPVKAVITWIIPADLARVTGEEGWLRTSPRYVLENGVPRHTGSFIEHRWHDPLAGLAYLAREQFAFVKAIGGRQREERQAELFLALMERLRTLARERLGAPLVVIATWPEAEPAAAAGASTGDLSPLQSVMARLRRTGVAVLATDSLTRPYTASATLIPHNGHPSAFHDELVAAELKRRLIDH